MCSVRQINRWKQQYSTCYSRETGCSYARHRDYDLADEYYPWLGNVPLVNSQELPFFRYSAGLRSPYPGKQHGDLTHCFASR